MDVRKIHKGVVAYFTEDVRKEIAERDNNSCVLCSSSYMIDYHHVLFGSEKKVNTDRNTKKNGVCACRDCHTLAHGCRRGEGERQKFIDYLNNIEYKNNRTA